MGNLFFQKQMKFAFALLAGVVAAQELLPEETDLAAVQEPEDELDVFDDATELVEENEDLDDEDDEDWLEEEDDLDEDLNVTWHKSDIAKIKAGKEQSKLKSKKLANYTPPHMRNKKLMKAKLERIGRTLGADVENWRKTPQAKALHAKLMRMKNSPQGKAVDAAGQKVENDLKAAGKSFHKIKQPFRKGFHVDNQPLG